MMRLPQPLTGFTAFQKCIERIYRNGSTAWFKFSHDKFFTGFVQTNGEFGIWATQGQDTDRKKTEFIANTYSFLSKLSQSKPGGVFYIPGQPTEFPLKDYCFAAADIGAEMDDGTTEEQWQRVEWFSAVSDLQPGLVISSGGKSIHLHLFLDADIPIAEATHLKKLLAIALLSDPAVVSPHQPMRIAGFYRQEKGREQTLDYWSDCRYTQEQFLQGLRAAFGAKGYVFPEHLSDKRWQRIKQVLTSKELTSEVKSSQIKEILALDETVFHPKPPQYDRPRDFQYDGSRIPLEVCLTKDDRELIGRGISEGSRGVSGFKLAVNLAATASYLDAKRIAYESDPRQLFDEFCTRCCPALSAHESEEIWRSANRGNPTPSLTEEAIENCIAAWQRKQNPQPSKQRDRTLSADEWGWKHGLPNWFRNQLAKLPQVFKGFGKRPTRNPAATPKPPSPPKIIAYIPGDRVPSREQYEQMGCPTIQFAREHRLQLYAELVAAGWQHILDRSGTGSGKSHDVGLAHPGQFDATKLLMYFAKDHRNPTVATIEANYTDLPVRHDGEKKGLLSDSSRQTALGNPHQRWAQNGEKPTITGNCPHTELFHVFKNKGYNEAALTAELNPICSKHCVHGWSCGNKSKALPGSDYRTVRSEVLKQSSRIRLNLESTPDDIGKEAGAFWEEASRLIKPIQTIEARLADFDQVFADIETEAPDVYDQLTPLRRGARPLLAGKVKLTQETYHGWNDVTLRQLLGAPPENLEELIATLETVQPDLEEILSIDRVLVAENTDVDSSAVKRLNRLVRRESYRDSKQQLESLPTNWLLPLLRIWGGLQPGAMRIGGGVLTITTRNSRPAEIAQGLKFNIYLDATANREFLARYLDIALADIIQVQQEPDRFDNLKIVQITGFGLAGRNRSDSLKQRCSALKAELRARHADIAFIEHQSHAEKETGDGWWFNHNRGSNEYQSRSALASIGSPYQNIGHLQDVYITLTGDRNVDRDAPGFSSFVLWLTQSEFVQLANRLRANRRSEQELPCYIATEIDLGFLQEYYPGSTIEQVDTFDISRSAGSATQQSHWKIQQAVLAAVEQTGKAIEDLTQVEAAKLAKVTQGRIAQVASKYGGWKAFLKLLASLLKGINTTTNNSPENNSHLDEDQQFLAQTYLPLVAVEDPPDAVQALLITVQSYGWRVFEAILSVMDSETKGRLLAAMMAGLPDALRKEFRAAVAAAGG